MRARQGRDAGSVPGRGSGVHPSLPAAHGAHPARPSCPGTPAPRRDEAPRAGPAACQRPPAPPEPPPRVSPAEGTPPGPPLPGRGACSPRWPASSARTAPCCGTPAGQDRGWGPPGEPSFSAGPSRPPLSPPLTPRPVFRPPGRSAPAPPPARQPRPRPAAAAPLSPSERPGSAAQPPGAQRGSGASPEGQHALPCSAPPLPRIPRLGKSVSPRRIPSVGIPLCPFPARAETRYRKQEGAGEQPCMQALCSSRETKRLSKKLLFGQYVRPSKAGKGRAVLFICSLILLHQVSPEAASCVPAQWEPRKRGRGLFHIQRVWVDALCPQSAFTGGLRV